MPDPKELTEYKTDHDLLIELRTIVLLMKQQLDQMTNNFVTQDQFSPVKTIAYGLVGAISLGVVGALLSLVLIK